MRRRLQNICANLDEYYDLILILHKIYGYKLAPVMIYATALLTIERMGNVGKMGNIVKVLKRYDPQYLIEELGEKEFEKYIKKTMLKAVRSEVQKLTAKAVANALKNIKGVDIDEIVKKASEELAKLLEVQD